jgi:WhiB family redox-sensing transcriptional regulator
MNQPGTRRDDLPETAWASDGLCAEMPAEIFDAVGSHVQTAKAACAHCTVARQCLRWAITTEIEDEVWGGRTPAERRRISVAFVLDPPPRSRPDVMRPVDVAALPNPTAAPVRPANARSTRRVKKLSPGSSELTVRAPKPRTPARPPNVERRQATNGTAALTRKPARTADERSAKPRPTVPRGTPPASPSRPAPR